MEVNFVSLWVAHSVVTGDRVETVPQIGRRPTPPQNKVYTGIVSSTVSR